MLIPEDACSVWLLLSRELVGLLMPLDFLDLLLALAGFFAVSLAQELSDLHLIYQVDTQRWSRYH